MLKLFPNPRLFSYVVARDYGFAPNPFFGFCTLATCKPRIRSVAQIGDWVVGTGSKPKGMQRRIVYAMRVDEVLTFDEYWHDPRFEPKRPNMHGSVRRAFGDNIYHRDGNGDWRQVDSHHSFDDGSSNVANVDRDTSADRVLVSGHFAYWGGTGPEIPPFNGCDICIAGQGHKSNFGGDVIDRFVDWLGGLDATGYLAAPNDW